MEKENLVKKLDALETRLFLINMIDRWSAQDYRDYDATKQEIAEVKAQLAAM